MEFLAHSSGVAEGRGPRNKGEGKKGCQRRENSRSGVDNEDEKKEVECGKKKIG